MAWLVLNVQVLGRGPLAVEVLGEILLRGVADAAPAAAGFFGGTGVNCLACVPRAHLAMRVHARRRLARSSIQESPRRLAHVAHALSHPRMLVESRVDSMPIARKPRMRLLPIGRMHMALVVLRHDVGALHVIAAHPCLPRSRHWVTHGAMRRPPRHRRSHQHCMVGVVHVPPHHIQGVGAPAVRPWHGKLAHVGRSTTGMLAPAGMRASHGIHSIATLLQAMAVILPSRSSWPLTGRDLRSSSSSSIGRIAAACRCCKFHLCVLACGFRAATSHSGTLGVHPAWSPVAASDASAATAGPTTLSLTRSLPRAASRPTASCSKGWRSAVAFSAFHFGWSAIIKYFRRSCMLAALLWEGAPTMAALTRCTLLHVSHS
mmetsp:Transcript_24669/g.58705  ORF Transcript_24669/g.58705 Transcript_24669/m.58705 type:complete len:375 (+) Transcript_24669:677-1801(+)